MNLKDLERSHPEWEAWLAVIGAVQEALQAPHRSDTISLAPGPRTADAPLLTKAIVSSDPQTAGLFARCCERAVRGGILKPLPGIASLPIESSLLESTLNGDADALYAMAERVGIDPEPLVAVASLAAVPILHAAACRLSGDIPLDWKKGYCPVCGAWPVLAEICGVERNRYLRCGRCTSAWPSHCLSCPYCETNNHQELASLVVEEVGTRAVLEVCTRCNGYLKSFTRLRSTSAEGLLVDDLASVALDLAAAERGYQRPAGPGYRLGVTVRDSLAAGTALA